MTDNIDGPGAAAWLVVALFAAIVGGTAAFIVTVIFGEHR